MSRLGVNFAVLLDDYSYIFNEHPTNRENIPTVSIKIIYSIVEWIQLNYVHECH